MSETTEPLRIEELYAFIASDKEGEGVIGYLTPSGWLPLVGADIARIESLRSIAQDIADTKKWESS